MRTRARTSRFWLLLALWLMVVAVSVPAAPGNQYATHGSAAHDWSMTPASPGYHELHDRAPAPTTGGHASTEAAPHTWWVVWPQETSTDTPRAHRPVRATGITATSAAISTSRPSRAPPRA